MATLTDILQYTIHLTDPVLVAQLQATKFYSDLVTVVGFGGLHDVPVGNLLIPPSKAAVVYSAPLLDPLGAPGVVVPFAAPSITSPWFNTSTAAQYPRNVLAGSRHSGGFLGIGGTTHRWVWMGKFEYSPPVGTSPITGEALQPMSVRRFIDGAEVESSTLDGDGGSGNGSGNSCRAASRHLQGFGYKFNNTNNTRTHAPTENGHAGTASGWDRFYMRPNVYPAVPLALWFCSGLSAAAGFELGMLPSGALTATSITATGVRTLLATSAVMPLRTWKKIDILFTYSATVPVCQVFINGVKTFDLGAQILTVGGGLQSAGNYQSTIIGDAAGNGKGASIDYDDWIGADLPAAGSALGIYPAYDFNFGSRVALVGARGFASDNAASWAAGGDWRATRQHHIGGLNTTQLSSSTALARLSITTDAANEVDQDGSAFGLVSMFVSLLSTRGTTSGQLGYRFTPAAAVMAAVNQTVGLGVAGVLYSPAGVTTPTKAAGLELVHDKGNDANAATVRGLFALVEICGIFGKEDVPASTSAALTLPAPPAAVGIHNAPYPRSPWAKGGGQAPTQPYAVFGGTYVGNGTAIDLTFKSPIHFLWIRPVTGSTGGMQWWSSMINAHNAGAQAYEPDAPVEVLIDPAFVPGAADAQQQQTLVRIVGNHNDKNAAGVTYAYVAISDPGQRFFAAGAFKVVANTVDVVETLDNTLFNPDAVFAIIEVPGATSTVKLYFKGTGSAATNISGLTTAEIAGMSKAAGSLTIKAALANVSTAAQIAYLALRKDDGSADAGLPGVMWLATYVGDGSASRTINFAPASGLRPQWAIIVGHNGTTVQRDHQHTGTTSTQFPNTANAATGITGGGIDSLSVGSVLNTNGVTFDVLVFAGDAVAVNGGFSGPVTNIPVDPAQPAGGAGTPYDSTFIPPDVPTPVGTTAAVEPGGDSTDFGDQCITASTKIINQALSHIGITKQIGNVSTEQSPEAQEARLHYSDDLSAVLRDYPWPFATRYAYLVRVAGTAAAPVNGDWVYSFRAPDNMMFARRIVNPDGIRRAFDPDPIDFRAGGDATGSLIYTNQQAVVDGASLEPELEYTVRPSCAASQGDALFRQALAWRHGATLAMSLARDEKKAQFCMAVYGQLLERARLAAAHEEQQDPPGDAEWITGRN